LAEERFVAFTGDPAAARDKLERILKSTESVWMALRRFVMDRHGAVTLMLGNHDIELSLPGVRDHLLKKIGEGRVEFLYDNEAYTCGPVLVEHGNRYDEWNAVPHGALRRVRSQLSRRLAPAPFPALPGSQLVVDVMNPLKKDYSFVDLLKPETAGVLPMVAALGAGSMRTIWQAFGKYRQTFAVDYDDSRQPVDETYIKAADHPDQAMFDLAENIAAGGDATQVNAITDALKGARDAVSEAVREYRRGALFKALRALAGEHRLAFEVEKEIATYETPARNALGAGYQVVIYGHTHLAKRVRLGDPKDPLKVYLNTGTWADLMRVPDALWAPDEKTGREALREFVTDLERDTVERWRRPVPTFARVELKDESEVLSGDVYFADGQSGEPVTTAGLKRRLARSD